MNATQSHPPVVAVDVGGTHARFAIARYGAGEIALDDVVTLQTRDFADFGAAWARYGEMHCGILPRRAAIAVAGPVEGGTIRFTNNQWSIAPHTVAEELALEDAYLLNDFEAVAHAAMHCGNAHFIPLAGPQHDLAAEGVTSVIGPGTGLGAAYALRDAAGWTVRPSEAGHIGFAPCDGFEDALLARLRSRLQRVSVERVVSGPAIVELYNALAEREGWSPTAEDDRAVWALALVDRDEHALAAVERFCQALGSVAGDITLAHGADSVVIAGGLGLRLAEYLPVSGFAERFKAKGRFGARLAEVSVRLLVHPQPGLLGAAVAAARR